MSTQVDSSNTTQAGDSHVVRFAPPRKKKWGSRARTGCATCRARHVKCDEARPVCGRCVTAGRVCSGINYGTTSMHHRPAWLVGSGSGSGSGSNMAEQSTDARESVVKMVERHSGSVQMLRGRGNVVLTRDLLPQGWHFSEACQYFNEVMLTRRIAKQIVPSDFHYPAGNTRQKFCPPPDHQHTVIMVALAHRISFIFHAEERGTTQLSQHKATAHLRACFYRHMGEAIRALNHHLVDINLSGVIWGLRKIANIVSAELYMVSTSWRYHVEGFLALVKHGGGIRRIMNHFPLIRLALYYMTIIANVANTTSPSHDLGVGSVYLSKEATRNLYSTTLYPSFPCATSLFMDMIRITELRDLRHGPWRDVQPNIVEIFRSIDEFVPDAWAEAYEIPKTAEINIIARMFKASVALYGVLALGKFQESWIDAAHYFPSLTNAGKMSHGPLRRALSGHLLGILEEAASTLSNKESLSWPLTVLGVGIADGSAEDKAFVKKALFDVGMDPNADAGPMDSRGMLLKFWDAGGTQWDECFNRPTLVLA